MNNNATKKLTVLELMELLLRDYNLEERSNRNHIKICGLLEVLDYLMALVKNRQNNVIS